MNGVEEPLLALVAATKDDGGLALGAALRRVLQEVAPYDRGELAYLREGAVQRLPLDDGSGLFVADDIVRHLAAHPVPVRLDDLEEAFPFPATRRSLEEAELRSLIALPLSLAGGPEGALVMARDYGWAFVGASLRLLSPIASMAGLCLERSIALSERASSVSRVRPIPTRSR